MLGRIANVIGKGAFVKGFQSSADDAARLAWNTNKAREAAAGASNYDDSVRIMQNTLDDLNWQSNPAREHMKQYTASEVGKKFQPGTQEYDDIYQRTLSDLENNYKTDPRYKAILDTPYQNDIGKAFAYNAGRKVAGLGRGVGNTVNAMGGPVGLGMNAMFMAPLFMSAGSGSAEQAYPTPTELQQQPMDNVNSAYQQELIYKAQLEQAKRMRREMEQQALTSMQQQPTLNYSQQSYY